VSVAVRVDDAVATIVIERPERRNALNHEALEELDAAVAGVQDLGARAVILTGCDGHFCAGADLTELEDVAFTERLRSMLDRLSDAPVVTIAAISGACMGLGMQLAIACDIRVATDDAYFGVPVAKLGLMVDHWTLQRLVSSLGAGAARHLVLTAEILRSDDAWRLGFIQQRGDLADAEDLARRVAGLAPLSIHGSKLGLNRLERHLDDEDYRAAFEAAWSSADLVEGRAAFAERRDPVFKGE
jgi:enoyl-CoA hydratase